ncbi:MAG: hypothetical protein K0R22_2851, partial [Sporomusa sp.]|nr:hypothetical protein [Sporomusa sp.]
PGERLPYKQDVGSSILSSPTIVKVRVFVLNKDSHFFILKKNLQNIK